MTPKVCIFIPTADTVEPETLASIEAQTYAPQRVIVAQTPPEVHSADYVVNLYRNCSANRNKARAEALATDADYFLSLDSDIVLPPHALAEFVKQIRRDHRVIGGWYQMIRSGRWVAGKWVADNTFINYRQPVPSLTATDMVGLGCAFMSRAVLEVIPFEHGTDLVSRDERGRPLIVGECGVFGNRVAEHGFRMYMDGDVICQHLARGE